MSSQAQIGATFAGFFSSLFTTSFPFNIADCISPLDHKIFPSMREHLSNPFTAKEVKRAVFHMKPLVSPRPNGFSAQFYQKNWETMGDEVTSFVLNVLNKGDSTSAVNDTYFSLIPKVKNPKKVTDFRPISLCNVIYKLVSKTLANRMKSI